jgi:hypothetical protein
MESFEDSERDIPSAFGIPIISPRHVYWKARSWKKSRIIAGLETFISLSYKTEYITVIVPGVIEAIIQLQEAENPLRIRHITMACGFVLKQRPAAVTWFKKWAERNSCSLQDDTIV